ncbi:sigma-54 dependent transcriptional regulator [Porphyromonadaceae bacterium W3.11]|nr:sigma-54 dependent transcriptional regulator [Porphyromonadaceae bacterium W3.11]
MEKGYKILVVDDDATVRTSLTLLLKRKGYDVQCAEGPDQALAHVQKEQPSVVIMDMNFTLTTTGREGLELLQRMSIYAPGVPVILMTAWGSIELAVKGMKLGAFDFITKPWNNLQLLKTIENAIEITRQNNADIKCHPDFPKIIGRSKPMQELLATVARVATTTAPILITGESGTGKELIAEAIHEHSKRVDEPFVKVNLGGISQSLFESEMFGHKKGAFTDAYADRKGRFTMADKGTIFLDEIGELDLSCQVKLLRVLQDQTFEVLGDSKPKKVDVRVISATNADLRAMVQDGTFREDLFYRINLIHLHIPALRERPDDIPLLVRHFAGLSENCEHVTFTDEAMQFLMSHPFPGNIRELKNLVERSILVSPTDEIGVEQLKQHIETDAQLTSGGKAMTLDEIEKMEIQRQIALHNGNLSRVAKSLGLSRAALYRRLDKYGL